MSQWCVEAVQQGGGHLGVAEHGGPFAESEIGGDEDRGALVEPADEVEEELAAGLSEREISELVEDDEVPFGSDSRRCGPDVRLEPRLRDD